MTWDDQPPVAIALDADFFCFDVKPEANGFTDAGQGLIPSVALDVTSRQIKAADRPPLL